jgi:hypothetical protein
MTTIQQHGLPVGRKTQAVRGVEVIFTTQHFKRQVPRNRKWKRINRSRINTEALVATIIRDILKIIVPLTLRANIRTKKHIMT